MNNSSNFDNYINELLHGDKSMRGGSLFSQATEFVSKHSNDLKNIAKDASERTQQFLEKHSDTLTNIAKDASNETQQFLKEHSNTMSNISTEGTKQASKCNNILARKGYYIVIDSDFGNFINKIKEGKYDDFYGHRYGNLGIMTDNKYKTTDDRIPILYDFNTAKHVSNKMIDYIISKGTPNEDTKSIPIFGTIILEIEIDGNATVDEIQTMNDTDKRYDNIHSDKDLICYEQKGIFRGLLKRESIGKMKIIGGYYNIKINETVPNGLFKLNQNENLTSSNIRVLKQLYNASLNNKKMKLQLN